jgi:ferric-dicitrate binding protein FerR (iron transport regulator)
VSEHNDERSAEEIKFEGIDRALANHDRRLAATEALAERISRLENQPVPADVDEIAPARGRYLVAFVAIALGAFLLFSTPRGPSIRA